MLHAAQRIVANSITQALRQGWLTDTADFQDLPHHPRPVRANNRTTAQADPALRRQVSRIHGPSTLTSTFVWGITDPDQELHVPPLSWLLTMDRYSDALDRLGPSIRAQHMAFLNEHHGLVPFRRDRTDSGARVYRRRPDVTREAMHAALTIAAFAIVVTLRKGQYREALPVHL